MNPKNATAYAGLVVLSLVWGMAFVAIKVVVAEMSPVNLALMRWLIASVPFLALFPFIGRPKAHFERKDVPRLLVVALANVAGYHISLNYAETTLSAGLSALLIAFGPIFIVVLSYLLLSEKAGRKTLLGLALAIAGTAVLSIGSVSATDFASFTGIFEGLVTALCYALFAVLGKPLVQKYGSAFTTIMAGLVGTAMMTPLVSGSFFGQVLSLSFEGWIGVLYLGLLSTVFGYLMFYELMSHGALSRLSIQLYLVPVVSIIGGATLLSEPVTVPVVIGGAMMLFAVAVTTWR
ncbi:MAG: DMT family transporter [Nitrososphaerota archaeon]|nr:DMT family transporter [Nitrososphaerota archaeon]MDG6975521.1 DMT family transporter [Nitrososphaerota archaeon]